ncbi:MAG: hybrid sensor histidine kinase/response regulator, partial [Spirosoma sp.]|nr:hybrid sensor histidine kinase/response regulator [Spirosoma sp.]
MNTVAPLLDVAEKKAQIRVLLVEDDEDDYLLTRALVTSKENTNIKLDWVDSYEQALTLIEADEHDVY